MGKLGSAVPQVLRTKEQEILSQWLAEQARGVTRFSQMSEAELKAHSAEILEVVREAFQRGDYADQSIEEMEQAQEVLSRLSREWAQLGFSPSETATFILSLKRPLQAQLREVMGGDSSELAEDFWNVNLFIDKLALFSMESYQDAREKVINLQKQELLELSTPVVRLWEGVLVLPLIGTLDSARTQIVMETLLQHIVDTNSTTAIIDITGVPTVDTLVAQHLLKTVAAARLMGAECIISGIRPQIAQTIVHLGVELAVTTKATLGDAFKMALDRQGFRVVSSRSQA